LPTFVLLFGQLRTLSSEVGLLGCTTLGASFLCVPCKCDFLELCKARPREKERERQGLAQPYGHRKNKDLNTKPRHFPAVWTIQSSVPWRLQRISLVDK
jgi:hypothetical protein